MSVEGEVTRTPTLFPIEDTAIQNGVHWMNARIHNPSLTSPAFMQLQYEADRLGAFTGTMSTFRRKVSPRSNPQAYKNGALFMYEILKNQAQKRGAELSVPSSGVLAGYFFDLLGGSGNRYEMVRVATTPRNINATNETLLPFYTRLVESTETTERERLIATFIHNSENKRSDFLKKESGVASVLYDGNFMQKYAHRSDGLAYGALDVYEVFQTQDLNSRLNDQWNIELR